MTNEPGESTEEEPTLPGLELPELPAGDLEAEVRKQLDQLQRLGYLEPHHAGLAALALVTAADIDRSRGRGAPSGRANLYRVMNEIFEALPQPEQASKDALEQVLDALRSEEPNARASA